jgi:transcriptional regulator with XRE-family HTH domain
VILLPVSERNGQHRQPPTLAALIEDVMAEDRVTLEAISKRSGVPLATIGAWRKGTRGQVRGPAPVMLRKLAKGLRRPEPMVFEAAGRTYPNEPDDVRERRHMHLYRDLSEREKRIVDEHMRVLMRSREPTS